MRKEDLKVTTPKKSIIYAFGTSPESLAGPWTELDSYRSRTYLPAYILRMEKGMALILQAKYRPDSKGAEGTSYREPQATLLEALDYTLEDANKRLAILEKYSHWHVEKDAALAELKALPEHWELKWTKTANIRMLWAEYMQRWNAIDDERRAKKAAADAQTEKSKAERVRFAKRLKKLGFIKGKDESALVINRGYSYEVFLNTELAHRLLDEIEAARSNG